MGDSVYRAISNPQRHAIMETEILRLGLIYILMKLCALTHQKDERLFCFYEDTRMFPCGAEVAFPLKKQKSSVFLLSSSSALHNQRFAQHRMQFIISLKKHSGPNRVWEQREHSRLWLHIKKQLLTFFT